MTASPLLAADAFSGPPKGELSVIRLGNAVQRAIVAGVPASGLSASVDVRLAALQRDIRERAADPKVLAFMERARQAGLGGTSAGASAGLSRSPSGLWLPASSTSADSSAADHLKTLTAVREALAPFKPDEIARMPLEVLDAAVRRIWESGPSGAAVPAAEPEAGPAGLRPSGLSPSHRRSAAKKASVEDPYGRWGVDLAAVDHAVRPQDDFFEHVNGTWLKSFQIPPDKSRYGVFTKLSDESDAAVKKIIEDAAGRGGAAGAGEKQIADLYKSFMNTDAVTARGLAPLAEDFAAIQAVHDKAGLAALFARANREGVDSPVALGVGPDRKNTAQNAVSLHQSGLGLPDREYYFDDGEESRNIRSKYMEYATALLSLAGESDAAAKAASVFALEKALAEHHWTKVENRQADKTYNKIALSELGAAAPGFDWSAFLQGAKVRPEESSLIVAQPSYFKSLGEVIAATPLETWKLYMKVRLLGASAAYLPEPFEKAAFEYSRSLSGAAQLEPRWQRGVHLVNGAVGELIGRVYAEKYFPASSKSRMAELVENLRSAYAERIQGLTWMGEETKRQALEKLRKFQPMVGYPDKWTDYSALETRPDDLFGNVRRSNLFDYDRALAKLGRPVDRTEWHMTPQTINAYYSPTMNVIVFPAAILQAPFFNPAADDAVNYGAIGAVIGHEMGHGFDDQGAKSDGDGLLRDWWTEADKTAFKSRTAKLVGQFDAFEPLPGLHVNGRLTLGENIGDLGGLTVAYHAYRMSLQGREPPVLDGYTGDQRFFLGWAQAWRMVQREKALRTQVATDPHAPARYRVNGVVRNIPEFYEAFGVGEPDKLYLPPGERVGIW